MTPEEMQKRFPQLTDGALEEAARLIKAGASPVDVAIAFIAVAQLLFISQRGPAGTAEVFYGCGDALVSRAVKEREQQ